MKTNMFLHSVRVMLRISLIPLLAIGLVCTIPLADSNAAVVGYDNFSYADGPINGNNGGTGWNYSSGTPSSWTGSAGVSGGDLVTGGGSNAFRDYGTNGGGSAFQATGLLFYRFSFTLGADIPNYFGLSSMDFGNERIKFGRSWEAGSFNLEYDNGGGWTQHNSGVSILSNTTYTLVGVLDFNNDRLALFINPDGSSYYDPTNGTTNAQAVGAYTGTNWSNAIRFESGGGGSDIRWHEVTVATLPTDVGLLNAIPEPSSYTLMLGGGALLLFALRRKSTS